MSCHINAQTAIPIDFMTVVIYHLGDHDVYVDVDAKDCLLIEQS